jgi:hypothetical protein
MTSRGQKWYFTKEELTTPVKPGGTDVQQANKIRRSTCVFIQKSGMQLRLYVNMVIWLHYFNSSISSIITPN